MKTVYLDRVNGSDDFSGLDPEKPVRTFDRAVAVVFAE
jgi:hypothetical protein